MRRERKSRERWEVFCSLQALLIKGHDPEVSSTIYRIGEVISSMLRCGHETDSEIETEKELKIQNLHSLTSRLPVKRYPCVTGKCCSSVGCVSGNSFLNFEK